MSVLTANLPTVLASFMASAVEFVEALTIVLAVGIVRGWRSAFLGTALGVVVLLTLVMVFGLSLSAVPLPVLQGVIGTMLLLFGLRWLRKAILRSAGILALHDEQAAFARESEALRESTQSSLRRIDMVAFLTSLKAVVLEGTEVVFIVVALGAGGTTLAPAAFGAALALLLVIALGLTLRRPLSEIPENALKFGVGVLLSAFGSFWVGEGLNFGWAGGDFAIVYLIVVFSFVGLVLVGMIRHMHKNRSGRQVSANATPIASVDRRNSPVASLARSVWGLFVDDGWLASEVLSVVAVAALMAHFAKTSLAGASILMVAALVVILGESALRRATA